MATIIGTVGVFGFDEDQQGILLESQDIDYKPDSKIQRDYRGVKVGIIFFRYVEVTAFDEDTQTVVLEVAKAIGSSLVEFHLAVEAFRDSVVAREAPHADELIFS